MKEIIYTAALAAICAALIVFIFIKRSECHDKGGAYIQGQCIEVRILK